MSLLNTHSHTHKLCHLLALNANVGTAECKRGPSRMQTRAQPNAHVGTAECTRGHSRMQTWAQPNANVGTADLARHLFTQNQFSTYQYKVARSNAPLLSFDAHFPFLFKPNTVLFVPAHLFHKTTNHMPSVLFQLTTYLQSSPACANIVCFVCANTLCTNTVLYQHSEY